MPDHYWSGAQGLAAMLGLGALGLLAGWWGLVQVLKALARAFGVIRK